MKLAVIFFSATGNTAKIADVISETLKTYPNIEIDRFDITSYSSRKKEIDLNKYNGIFFGSPIYALRAPKILREWLKTLEGNSLRVSAFFTYGGVKVGIAHESIKKILEGQDFQVVSTGEFLGKHTYNLAGWNLMSDRPNQEDLDIAKEYTEKTLKRFMDEDTKIVQFDNSLMLEGQINRIEDSVKKRLATPSRHGAECSLCKTCEDNCPTKAMNAKLGEADRMKCIACLKCVDNCPDEVLKFKDLSKLYPIFAERNNLTPELLKKRKSKYYL